ncbi:cytochrome P450 [Spinellus fusiger]|nr:cytochrome P450 [Spinellus fusiger]
MKCKRKHLSLIRSIQTTSGPILQIKVGVQTWVLVNNPNLAHELFCTQGKFTSSRPAHAFSRDIHSREGRGVIFAPISKKWHRSMALVMFFLTPKFVDTFTSFVEEESDRLVDCLLTNTKEFGSSSTVDCLHHASFNTIMNLCFGFWTESPTDPIIKTVFEFIFQQEQYAGFMGDIGSIFPYLSWASTIFGIKRAQEKFVKEKRDDFFGGLIKNAVAGDRHCAAKMAYENKEKYELSDQDILVLMSDTITAGAEAPSLECKWFLAIVSQYPDVQKKIQVEIDEYISKNGRLPIFKDHSSFPYLLSVQRECFRYRPIFTFIFPREAKKEFEFSGYRIPKDAVLSGGLSSMHSNKEVFENPEVFNPDRYKDTLGNMTSSANGPIEQRDQYNFGWGRRMCPGIYMAELEMFYFLTRIFAKCNMEPAIDADGNPVHIDLSSFNSGGISLSPSEHTLRFTPRN